ncbi:MAG TPA: histidinol-phosphate transaminase [Sphaerochaeta sp.]|nr:histidinol-phosphate transaminase [Sphaerochaeta sp.]
MRSLVRKNIASLRPYSSARNEFTGTAEVYLDANESAQSFVSLATANRYPDPQAALLRSQIAEVMGLPPERTVIGSGSDELIDNLIRIFCEPRQDSILTLNPTYGAYRVFSDINDVAVKTFDLDSEFAIDQSSLEEFLAAERAARTLEGGQTKLFFLCSPNNPTGNAFSLETIEAVCECFDGIVAVDEAYQDFSSRESAVSLLDRYEKLVVLRTFSKAWGIASARVGIAITSPGIVALIASMKYPYNVGGPSQALALEALSRAERVRESVGRTVAERERLATEVARLPFVERVFPSDANFFLVRVREAKAVYRALVEKGIIVRDRSGELHCSECLRLTVGSSEENERLLNALKEYGRG